MTSRARRRTWPRPSSTWPRRASLTGSRLNLITSQGLYASAVDEAQAVQAQLGQVGIKVNVQTLSASAYVSDWLGGNFEAAIAENSGNIDPNTMYARYFTSTGTYNKVAGYSSPTLNSLFAQGIATTDVAKRQTIYQQISASAGRQRGLDLAVHAGIVHRGQHLGQRLRSPHRR